MPDLLHHLEKLSLLVFLVSSMLAMGLTLTVSAMIAPLRNARFVLLVLGLNFLVAPALAWLLAAVFRLESGYAFGMLALGCAAGAPFLPKLVEIARGDAALAAAITGLLTVGTILFLPFALPLMVPGLQANAWAIAYPLVLLILLPLGGGMFVKSRAPLLADRAAPFLAKIGNASLLLYFILLLGLNARLLFGTFGSGAILVALLYFVSLFIVGWLLAGRKPEVRAVMGFATSGRNFGAALIPAGSGLSGPKGTAMIVVGATVCLIVSFIAAGWVRRATLTSHVF